MTAKDCNKSAATQKKLSLRSILGVGVRFVLLTTPVWALPLISTAASNTIIFNGDFEDVTLSGWDKETCCDHSVQVVNSPKREGSYAAKFTLYKDDPDVASSRRTELKQNAVPAKSEYWYGFSNYLPADYARDPSMEIVAQWHSRPDFDLGEDWNSPPLYLKTDNGNWEIKRRWDHKQVTKDNQPAGKETINLGSYQTGSWNDWVFHVKWSYESDGLVEVWKNGQLVARRTGPNTYNDKVGPYQKLGIYKPDWKYDRDKSTTTKRVIYYDSVRVGGASASYEDVKPK